MESAHLRLVDTVTGQVEDRCPDCLNLERQNRSLLRQRTLLEHEIARIQGSEPEADQASEALGYWARRVVEEGWWQKVPKYKPGDERWTACRARQKEGRSVEDCNTAVDGALLQGDRRIERPWVDAVSIFRNNKNFEQHLERALDPNRQWVRAVQEVPVPLRDRWSEIVDQADPCACGHLRFDHGKQGDGSWACGVHGCYCTDFDDFHLVADAWIKSQTDG